MNWGAINFDWNQVRAFLATAEEGSFSAAARALNQTQPTLGRQVAALESALGVVLFERVGRSVELTPTGRELLTHVRAMAEAAGRLSLSASGQAQTIDGMVRITASDLISAYLMPPVLARLREMAPRLEIDLVATNDIQDIQRREADIAIRHLRPTEPELIARLVREMTASFYATQGYLDRSGVPADLSDLSTHDFIGMGDTEQFIAHMAALGLNLGHGNFRLGSRNGLVAWALARAGLGVSAMADDVAAATPEMVRLIPGMAPIRFPVWLTTHRELHTSARIRLVFDLLAEALSAR